ncbi:sporulation protein [Bacillus mangrovi]|uniref:Sporulation protein n=1 Tax=Metabacillus mangrovi TaxID=1491830 RepID=A0A7X2V2C2_9BACI|nr:sporulation protein [Metabacillus mangrovi]MTH51957.1 sporulation protein [Metabacillus mangrovi]
MLYKRIGEVEKMLLRKWMSRLGIGAAKIDLVLDHDQYKQGDVIIGRYDIYGGTIEQKLKRIESDLVQTIDGEDRPILNNCIYTASTVLAEENRAISFKCRLPADLPVSDSDTAYKFVTKLVFESGTDSLDHDEIKITSA